MTPLAGIRARLQALPELTFDSIVAALVLALCMGSLLLVEPHAEMGEKPSTALTYVLIAAMTIPLAWRRRYPLQVFLVISAGMAVYELFAFGGVNVDFYGPIVALYSVIIYGPRKFAPWAPVMAFLIVVVMGLPSLRPDATAGWFFAQAVNVSVLIGLVWFVADTVRQRREHANELAAKNRQLEQAQQELAHQAVADERVRIARELHDVVAHSMSVIAVQSGMGRMVIASQPDEAAGALANIEETSRSALHEMRRILSVLRSDDETEGSLAPAPTLPDVEQQLIAPMRAAGLEVDLETTGSRGAVPPGVDLSAYRIIQEALTNVIKHAGPARATVTIDYGPSAVTVEIVDDGRGAAALTPVGAGSRAGSSVDAAGVAALHGGGNGLVGMRERAAVYGGQVDTGPRAGGGFCVRARLPYDGARA